MKRLFGLRLALLFGMLVTQIVGTPIRWADAAVSKTSHDRVEKIVRKVPIRQKAIALTFDDGPSRKYTPQVLQLLSRYHAKATFFVIGYRVKAYPQLVRAEMDLHHEVANHTYTHVVVKNMSSKRIESEIRQAHDEIMAQTRRREALFFRPPRGYWDRRVLKVARDNGYAIVLWSVDSRDWSNPGTDKIVQQVIRHVESGDILLFHDQGGDRSETISALRQILPLLKAKGFRFITVSELLEMSVPKQR